VSKVLFVDLVNTRKCSVFAGLLILCGVGEKRRQSLFVPERSPNDRCPIGPLLTFFAPVENQRGYAYFEDPTLSKTRRRYPSRTGTCGSGTQIRVESYDTSGLLTASSLVISRSLWIRPFKSRGFVCSSLTKLFGWYSGYVPIVAVKE